MNKDIASLILIGHQLSRSDAEKLERELFKQPDSFEDRLKLIGYHYKHYYCCKNAGSRRADHVVWLIRRHPDFQPILTSYLHTHLLDRRGYACIKAAWQAAIARHPLSVAVHCNMAAFVQFSEPELSVELYEKALRITPNDAAVLSRLEKLNVALELLKENRAVVVASGIDYFTPGAVPCPEKSGDADSERSKKQRAKE